MAVYIIFILLPHQVAETIITVGDQDRVADVSKYFDTIEHKANHREFITHTGYLNNHRITVISTGIGTDNIDIVLQELDMLFNVDLVGRKAKESHTPLRIIRLGTSGCLQPEISPLRVSFALNTLLGSMVCYTIIYLKTQYKKLTC
jgi:uridine phosphorylase